MHPLSPVAGLSLWLLAALPAQASNECPFIDTAAVATAFADASVSLFAADASHGCTFQFASGDIADIAIHKRESPAEAKASFKAFKDSAAKENPRSAHAPAIGQQAFFGLTPPGAQRPSAILFVLQDERVLMVTYTPMEPGRDVDGKVTAPLLAVARQVNKTGAKADQTYGNCGWFTEAQARKLLGPGKLSIQRNGPDNCIASIGGKDQMLYFLAKKTERDPNVGRAEPGTGLCPGVLLPQFGDEGVAEYNCPAPMNTLMQIKFRKNGVDVQLSYRPPGRNPNDADVQALLPIVKRAYDAL